MVTGGSLRLLCDLGDLCGEEDVPGLVRLGSERFRHAQDQRAASGAAAAGVEIPAVELSNPARGAQRDAECAAVGAVGDLEIEQLRHLFRFELGGLLPELAMKEITGAENRNVNVGRRADQ